MRQRSKGGIRRETRYGGAGDLAVCGGVVDTGGGGCVEGRVVQKPLEKLVPHK